MQNKRMKTTQIILEHLIAGVQASTWIVLIILTLFGLDWIQLDNFALQDNIMIAVLLSFVYPFGIIVDNLADSLLKKREKKIRQSVPGGTQSMRGLLQRSKDEGLEEYFDYLRMRIRICRSAFLNIILITLSLFFFTIFRLAPLIKISLATVLISELIIGILLAIIAYYSWHLLTRAFGKKIAKRYQELENISN